MSNKLRKDYGLVMELYVERFWVMKKNPRLYWIIEGINQYRVYIFIKSDSNIPTGGIDSVLMTDNWSNYLKIHHSMPINLDFFGLSLCGTLYYPLFTQSENIQNKIYHLFESRFDSVCVAGVHTLCNLAL